MIENFLNQLRDNPRLRWGVAAIIGIFWLYVILLLRDTLQEQGHEYRATAQSISRLRAQLAQPAWTSRVAPARTLAVQLEGMLWQAPTSGLAQAAFQEWLNSSMTRAGVGHPQITVSLVEAVAPGAPDQIQGSGSPVPPDLWQIKAKLNFDFNANALLNFMGQIENHDKQIVVDMLKVNKEPLNRIEIELRGYFQKQTTAAPSLPHKELVPF